VISLGYGIMVAVAHEGFCRKHPEVPVARSAELDRIVAPGAKIAYDVLAHVGLARFIECRQSNEIHIWLARRPGMVEVGESTVRYLARKFVAYFQIVHEESAGLLRAAMRDRGGYILHVDGTCEGPSEVLLLCVDSLSGQILESRRISSENEDEVRAVLEDVRRHWGRPLAVVHDLRPSLFPAAAKTFPGLPQFVCHYHLAADVGGDILSGHHDALRNLFRRTKVRAKLRALIRSLKDDAVSQDTGEHRVNAILGLRSRNQLREHVSPEGTKGAVHGIASWILEYAQAGEGYGFPFDLPYLNLYERILSAHGALREAIQRWPKQKRGPLGHVNRLKEILDAVVVGEDARKIRQVVNDIKRDRRVFEQFRAALRICPKGGKKRRNDEGASRPLSSKRHEAILNDLRDSLNRQARTDGPSARACRIVVEHLDKYWKYLFGHVLRRNGRSILVPRTNNIDEGTARLVKRQCRRLHGRGHVCGDLEAMPAAAALIQNLNNRSYCETVYGGSDPDKITKRFSYVDPKAVARLMRTWREDRISTRLPRKLRRLSDLPVKVARFLSVAVRELEK
jgi:hypothetical protein